MFVCCGKDNVLNASSMNDGAGTRGTKEGRVEERAVAYRDANHVENARSGDHGPVDRQRSLEDNQEEEGAGKENGIYSWGARISEGGRAEKAGAGRLRRRTEKGDLDRVADNNDIGAL